jgi:ubiquitin C-terminal hydrolase
MSKSKIGISQIFHNISINSEIPISQISWETHRDQITQQLHQTDKYSHQKCISKKCNIDCNCLRSFTIPDLISSVDLDIAIGPKGLKNFGATCFVNTLLQMWFNNLPVRYAIYNQPLNNEFIQQLAKVFARLELSVDPVIEPIEFIEYMGLDKNMQQDSQEFSKLLMTRIEEKCATENENLIKDNFQGEYEYVTQCLNCKNTFLRPCKFYELEVRITKKMTLDEGLKDITIREEMTGQNQYMCGHCNLKCDAIRYIQLKRLPRVRITI